MLPYVLFCLEFYVFSENTGGTRGFRAPNWISCWNPRDQAGLHHLPSIAEKLLIFHGKSRKVQGKLRIWGPGALESHF